MLNSRKACLGGHPCEPETLKEVLHCATHHQPTKAFQQVADECGMKVSTLWDMVNPNEPDYPPMRILPGLLAATKEKPILARYLAKLQSGVFVAMPDGGNGIEQELFTRTTEVMKHALVVARSAIANAQDGLQ